MKHVCAVKSKQPCSMPGEYLANLSIVIHFQLGFKFDIGIYGPETGDTTTEQPFLVTLSLSSEYCILYRYLNISDMILLSSYGFMFGIGCCMVRETCGLMVSQVSSVSYISRRRI